MSKRDKVKVFFSIAFALLIAFGLITISYYNTFPTLDEEVKSKWSQVQNNYKRRADLIPNLVSTVKAYATHEKDTFTAVTEARSKATQVNVNNLSDASQLEAFNNAQEGLSSALSKLMLVVEKYPELKADKNFLALQSQLEGTENRIAVARKDYIEAVKNLNLALRKMPSALVAKIFFSDLKAKEAFIAGQSEQDAPNVSF